MEQKITTEKEATPNVQSTGQTLLEQEDACEPWPASYSLEPSAGTSKRCRASGSEEIFGLCSFFAQDKLEQNDLDIINPGISKDEIKVNKNMTADKHQTLPQGEPQEAIAMEVEDVYESGKTVQYDDKPAEDPGDGAWNITQGELYDNPSGENEEVQVGRKRKLDDMEYDSEVNSNQKNKGS